MALRSSHAFFAPLMILMLAGPFAAAEERTQNFDVDPGWDGRNNHSTVPEVRTMVQEFGYSNTSHAGGKSAGELGGMITPAGEPAYYARPITKKTYDDRMMASGTLNCTGRHFNVLVCFFNANTLKEWRTPNTIALRLYGRGDVFYAYVEYATGRWRAGGDSPRPFAVTEDPQTGRKTPISFASNKVHRWSLTYDPLANNRHGAITATIDDESAVCNLEPGHKKDGGEFNHFGLLNVVKHADTGGEVWLDDVAVDGQTEDFSRDPRWDEFQNRRTYVTTDVRPRFDFGYSATNHAGGQRVGELGGLMFRGDNRDPAKMAYYGDGIGPLSIQQTLRAGGKISLRRANSDSTTLFGFFDSKESTIVSDDQSQSLPKNFLGIAIEGPSRHGFFVYPACRTDGDAYRFSFEPEPPRILPDGSSHDWTLQYTPPTPRRKGRITVTLDGKGANLNLDGRVNPAAQFDRFGLITTCIDGNGQGIYFDDLSYTSAN